MEENKNTMNEEEVREETINETEETIENETTEETMNEEKAEPKAGLLKKIIGFGAAGLAVVLGFFKKIFGGKKNADEATEDGETEGEEKKGFFSKIGGFFGKIGGKISNFFNAKCDFTKGENEIRACGMTAILAYRCAKFARKIVKKIGGWFGLGEADEESEGKSVSAIAKVFHVLVKVLAFAGTAAFCIAILYYVVNLLPQILAAIAKCIAVCLIIEVVFSMLGYTTGEYVKE